MAKRLRIKLRIGLSSTFQRIPTAQAKFEKEFNYGRLACRVPYDVSRICVRNMLIPTNQVLW